MAGRWCDCRSSAAGAARGRVFAASRILDIDGVDVRGDAALVHLADLLVALAVFGLIAAATFTTLQEGLRAYTIGAARAESQQSGRVALERLAGDLRIAGLGPQHATFAAISLAEPTRVVLHRDLDGDGLVTASGETITWHLTGRTLRRDAGGGAQPIIDGVRSFVLEYLDAAGEPTTRASDVRSVVITLVTEAESILAGRDVATTFATRVRLRNR